ncbi:MAG: hypothetical protein QXN36_01630 [Candidatus Bathyarchaeia archaeon]
MTTRNFPKHRYKFGKQKRAITIQNFKEMLDRVDRIDLGKYDTLTVKSFLALLYWTGLRKTEVHGAKPHRYILPSCKKHSETIIKETEAVPGILKEDIEVKGDVLYIEAVARKHGKREAPLELWIKLPFVDLIVEQWKRTEPKQRVWPLSEWDSWQIMKRIDKKKYLHYFRFNRITELCSNPKLSVADICSWTGLTPATVNEYMERSGRFIKRTMEAMKEQYATA